jgi:hypothetical protein
MNLKKDYQKPELKQIALRPEQAILAKCKSEVKVGPGISGCQPGGMACSTLK